MLPIDPTSYMWKFLDFAVPSVFEVSQRANVLRRLKISHMMRYCERSRDLCFFDIFRPFQR